jgi:hypothetical protein
MAKKAKMPEGVVRWVAIKGRKSQPTKPKNLRRKPYRGQGKP